MRLKLSIFILLLSSLALAETTESLTTDPEEGETYQGEHAPMACKIRVTGGYNVRVGPSVKDQRCSVFESTEGRVFGAYDVSVLGLYSDSWVKFSSPETKNCPGGIGWAHKNAFNDDDYTKFANGECGRDALDGGRTQTPQSDVTKVKSINSRGHDFPLKQCMGLKNDGGLGHYNAPRVRNGRHYGHTGCDYYSPKGTSIYSPCDGKVTGSVYGDVTGNMIVITCNNGDQFKFMHMHSRPPKAKSGARVSKGSLVGGVGNTGNARSQAPHLHTEAVINGRRVDPQSLWECGGDSGH